MHKILVTGAAGFIGFHLCNALVKAGHYVTGIDNINDYYDVSLKLDRLKELGVNEKKINNFEKINSQLYKNFTFAKLDIDNKQQLFKLCEQENFTIIVNLAAQAGVRYSLENPDVYVQSNVVGFLNILEAARHFNVGKLVYASSSSIYGNSNEMPFSIKNRSDEPISLYAATKKSNELMAYTYSHLFGIETIGLRFFTVYGPWGRPDMAISLFTDAILNDKPIKVFNNGNQSRDFTYVDDIVNGLLSVILTGGKQPKQYQLYNIGNSKPVKLEDFISEIEKATGKKAIKQYLPMQPGDVESTWADMEDFKANYDYSPEVSVSEGVGNYVKWYSAYYK
jgi:UDP-glucuronate 4-epimerase